MRGYVEATWGQWKAAMVRDFTADAAARGVFSILSMGGKRVGALLVTRHVSHMQLEQIYISPAHQRRGIGTRLLNKLKAEARRSRKPLRLRVLRVNPARGLYEHLGFHVTAVTEERCFMEYRGRRRLPSTRAVARGRHAGAKPQRGSERKGARPIRAR